jgi:Toprim-like
LPACAEKQHGRGHQCFAVNTDTGAYHCLRCNAKGKLRDFWTEPTPPQSRRAQGQVQLRKAFALTPQRASTTTPIDHAERLGVPINDGAAGAAYLERRGIPLQLAAAAGVRFSATWGASSKWSGVPAVVFPMRDESGAYVAAHGRYVTGNLKARTEGPTSLALFETPGALEVQTFALVEAPIDALSLTALGLPAVAMVGTSPQAWLHRHVYERRVLIATDADDAGDTAAAALVAQLGSFGAQVERLRPPVPTKDWNEALSVYDRDTLARFVQSYCTPAVPIADPRDDLPPDTALWTQLLTRAHAIDGSEPEGAFGALSGLRALGAGLQSMPNGVRLVPGDLGDEYGEIRETWLLPHADLLKLLLGAM